MNIIRLGKALLHQSTRPIVVMLFTTIITLTARAQNLSLDAAKSSAENGGRPGLVRYTDAVRTGFVWGLLEIEANQLVDTRTYSSANAEKEPLMKHIRCIQRLRPADLVTKALNMNPSRPDLSSKVDTFSFALGLTIDDLCPPLANFSIDYAAARTGQGTNVSDTKVYVLHVIITNITLHTPPQSPQVVAVYESAAKCLAMIDVSRQHLPPGFSLDGQCVPTDLVKGD